MRPFYETGNRGSTIRLYQEDCVEAMRQHVKPASVDAVVTSPPYNIGVRYSSYYDRRPRVEYLSWLEKVARNVRRVLSNDGSFFLNIGSTPSDPWIPWDVAQKLRPLFVLQNVIHWVKSIAVSKNDSGQYPNKTGSITVGHYKPIGGARYINDSHEYILGNVPLDRLAIGVPYQDKSNIGRWKSAKTDLHCRGNTWFVPYQTIQNREKERPPPSSFPVQLPEMCMRLHGLSRTRLAMDPFVGLGSSALAAYRLAVPFVGFDIDRSYLSEAKRRLINVKRQNPPNNP